MPGILYFKSSKITANVEARDPLF